MDGKIKALQKKYNIKTIAEFMSEANKIGKALYKYYLGKIVNDGMICTLKEALLRIERSEYKPENINLLKEFIKDANESRSVAETFRMYKSAVGKTEAKRILFMLDNIDTNCLTVTGADAKLFDNGYIPTPLELYEEFMK